MSIIQCQFCRKPFNSLGSRICPSCMTEIDEAFVKIRDYLDSHPGSIGADELAKRTEVQKEIILHLMRDGRLMAKGVTDAIRCEMCRKPIPSGRICDDCKAALSKDLGSVLPKPAAAPEKPGRKTDSNPKMHIKRDK